MEYKITYATMDELDSWMELVRFVSWNFPGLETEELLADYQTTVIKNMNRRSAICAVSGNKVVGVLLFSIKHNQLCCMAVHPDYRNNGIARHMIAEMMNNLDKSRDIIVETFLEEDVRGTAPRALYHSLGFEPDELIESFGCLNQVFVLSANKIYS